MKFHDECPLCGFKCASWAVWDFHLRVDHAAREDRPCEICGKWDDERTVWTEFGWCHQPCSDQLAYDSAANWADQRDAS